MKVNGNEMAITLRRDANLTALPFCNETLRQINEFYTLPPTVDKKKAAVYIPVKKEIAGCVVSRVTACNVAELFEIIADDAVYDLLVNRKTEKTAYRNIRSSSFEFRANNTEAFYFRVNVLKSGTITLLMSDSIPKQKHYFMTVTISFMFQAVMQGQFPLFTDLNLTADLRTQRITD